MEETKYIIFSPTHVSFSWHKRFNVHLFTLTIEPLTIYFLFSPGKSQLPAPVTMVKDIKRKRDEIARRYFAGPRHTMQIDWIPFLDELASQFGAKPNIWKYAFTDPILFYHLLLGPCVPYQWRLSGPGSWSGARKAILEVQERIDAAFKTRASTSQPQIANGNSEPLGCVKSSSNNSFTVLLFTLLRYFPTLIKGAKYSLMVACGLLFIHNLLNTLRAKWLVDAGNITLDRLDKEVNKLTLNKYFWAHTICVEGYFLFAIFFIKTKYTIYFISLYI